MTSDKINVEKVKHNTMNHLKKQLGHTRVHAADLLRNTEDWDGYDELNTFLDDLQAHMDQFGRTLMD